MEVMLHLITTRQVNSSKIVFNALIHHFLGCDHNDTTPTQESIMDDILALPPPKQFRDLASPTSSVTTNGFFLLSTFYKWVHFTIFTDDEEEEEEINAVDNLLYHIIDLPQTTSKMEEEKPPNQCNNSYSKSEEGSSEGTILLKKP